MDFFAVVSTFNFASFLFEVFSLSIKEKMANDIEAQASNLKIALGNILKQGKRQRNGSRSTLL